MTKKILIGLTSFAMLGALVAGPVVVLGANGDVDQTNQNTGPRSRNHNRARIVRNRTHTINNRATAFNDVFARIRTGDNSSRRNTRGGSITTGGATLRNTTTNTLNEDCAVCPADLTPASVEVTQTNRTTGPDSRNTNRANVEASTDINVTNRATVDNITDVVVHTGNNESVANTSSGDITTGDVSITVNTTNELN